MIVVQGLFFSLFPLMIFWSLRYVGNLCDHLVVHFDGEMTYYFTMGLRYLSRLVFVGGGMFLLMGFPDLTLAYLRQEEATQAQSQESGEDTQSQETDEAPA